MNFQKFFNKFIGLSILVLLFLSAAVLAQVVKKPRPTLVLDKSSKEMPVVSGNNLYCAGYVQSAAVNTENKIVGAEDEQEQSVYAQGDNLYISFGSNKGVNVGDVFTVVRPRGQVKTNWTKKRNLGFYVQEVGALEVIKVKPDVSVARVKNSCDNLLLDDLLQPVEQRTSPMSKARPALDVFAESTGRASGRIFMARDGREVLGREQIVYIDLGAEDNVSVGDYLTVYRPLGKGNLFGVSGDEADEARRGDFQSNEYRGGQFSNLSARKSGERAGGEVVTTEKAKKDRARGLRKVVGEIVILNVKEKTATAVITRTAQEIHTGDMVELQ